MLDLEALRYLVAFADLGTLSRVAEAFHISTPSVTRSMQHLEEQFASPLFVRGKNRIELNETGQVAVEAARKLLQAAEQTVEQVRAAWEDGSCDLAILPFPLDGAKPLLRENLFVCVPPEHELAKTEAADLCRHQRL